MESIIMHIDTNNAFLSWTAVKMLEEGSKIDIRNTYAVIGGDESKRNGIVLAKSPLCKKINIKTGDTIYQSRLKCKDLKVYEPDFKYYAKKSNELFELLKTYTPDIEVASIDECYIDYGKVKNMYGDEVSFAYKLKDEIYKKLGFTVNIGIANNKLCAKMASDFSKPYKVHTLYDYEVNIKMQPLPIEKLFGIGKKTVPKLKELGINTIKDLADFNLLTLKKHFKNQAEVMINSAKGIGDNKINSDIWHPKGIGHEFTLAYDTNNIDVIEENLLLLSEMVAIRLRRESKYAYVVSIIIKNKDFIRKSHQKKLDIATNETDVIYKTSKDLYLKYFKDEKIRLIGIRLDNLTLEKVSQISLFQEEESHNEKLDHVLDNLKEKYGYNIISKASIYKNSNKKNRRGL